MSETNGDRLLESLRRQAEGAAEGSAERSVPTEEPDLIDTLRATKEATGEAADVTIGGYRVEHDRPAAFEGADGQPYTVDVDAEETGDPDRPWAAFLVFVRWAATGAGIMGHVESGDVARGRTEEAARAAAEELTLFEAKAELDAAIERGRLERGETRVAEAGAGRGEGAADDVDAGNGAPPRPTGA